MLRPYFDMLMQMPYYEIKVRKKYEYMSDNYAANTMRRLMSDDQMISAKKTRYLNKGEAKKCIMHAYKPKLSRVGHYLSIYTVRRWQCFDGKVAVG